MNAGHAASWIRAINVFRLLGGCETIKAACTRLWGSDGSLGRERRCGTLAGEGSNTANAKMQSGKTRGIKLTVPQIARRRVLQVSQNWMKLSDGLFARIKTNISGCVVGFEFNHSLHLMSRRDFRKVEVTSTSLARNAESLDEVRAHPTRLSLLPD